MQKSKKFLVEHKSGDKRWCTEEIDTGFISPTSSLMFVEMSAPPAWHLRKPMWKRVFLIEKEED